MKIIQKIFQDKTKFLLIFLTIFAFLIRFVGQSKIPYGFHRDEAGIAYSAYSILKTGKDEWGRWFPLHFKALGDYPPGGYNYLTTFFMIFLGPVELAERMPAIVFGSLLVPLIYLFVKEYFRNKDLALITAFLTAFSPWDVVQSRSGSEPIVALFFTLLAWLFLKKWVKKQQLKYLLVTGFLYILAFYTYNGARVFLPLMHLIVVWFLASDIKTKKIQAKKLLKLSIPIVFIFVFLITFVKVETSMRFQEVSLINRSLEQVNFQALFYREAISKIPVFVSRVLHNKVQVIIFDFMSYVTQYFSGNFLFFQGGFPLRYFVPGVGVLYLIVAPFLLIGLFDQKILSKKQKIFLCLWLVLAPLAGSITAEDVPHVKRALYLFSVLHIFSAVGLLASFNYLKKYKLNKLFLIFFFLIFSWNFSYFMNQYLIHTKYETINHRSYGYKELFAKAASLENQYKNVIVFEGNDTPHVFYLFYSKYDPKLYQEDADKHQSNLFSEQKKTWSIGQYMFNPGGCPDKIELKVDELYLSKLECETELKPYINMKDFVLMPDGSKKFIIFEYNGLAIDK